ncbi:FHA domain-containing protein [Microbacterium sp.]|uniref:FHA domain-containing protein n=1 Tax=Microbacterium sp. TaxID=51671 RepID=UPI0027351AF6|nr:FHA domain-containing protein [Microbacterium sp.]MDP3950475.1 FHA domain-containing protein [Microbacterium sp.]
MQTTYRPGDWYVLVAPGALIAVSPDAPEQLIASLWQRQRSGGDLAAVIDAVTEHAAGSFAAILPFAAVVLEGPDARIAVRGDVTVQLTGPEGSESFTGTNVTTWSERFVANTSRIAIDAGDGVGSEPLPIMGGVVRATNVSADVEPSDVAVPDTAVPDTAAPDVAVPDVAAPDVALPAVIPVAEAADEPTPEAPAPEPVAEEAPAADEPSAQSEPEPATEQIPEVSAEESGDAAEESVEDDVDGATLVPTDISETSDIDEFEQLFGATIASPNAIVRPATIPPAPPAPSGTPVAGTADGDHDGATISAAEARALRQNVPTAEPDAPTTVLPVVSGGVGRVRVSTGQVVALDRTVIIGRRPRSTRASGADLPHLIAVESPQQDISRSHLEIRPEGDTVVVVDLHTTNGSTLLRPGADPLRLHPGEQTLVLSGDVVDLGDGVTVAFEDLP